MRAKTKGAVFFSTFTDEQKIAFMDVCTNKNYAVQDYFSKMHFIYRNTGGDDEMPEQKKLFEKMFDDSLSELSQNELMICHKASKLSEISGLPFIAIYEQFDGTESSELRLIKLCSHIATARFLSSKEEGDIVEMMLNKIKYDGEVVDNKTGQFYYNMIPADVVPNFIESYIQCNKDGLLIEDYLKKEFKSLFDFFGRAFIWHNTEQGFEYWNEKIKAISDNYYKNF